MTKLLQIFLHSSTTIPNNLFVGCSTWEIITVVSMDSSSFFTLGIRVISIHLGVERASGRTSGSSLI